jgi:hypothetical protein
MEDKTDNTKAHIPKWVYWVWLISIIAIGLSIAAIYMNSGIMWNVESVSISIVLGFVGILATFIVVSNHAQVKGVKDEFLRKEKALQGKIEQILELKKTCNNLIVGLHITQGRLYKSLNINMTDTEYILAIDSYLKGIKAALNYPAEYNNIYVCINEIRDIYNYKSYFTNKVLSIDGFTLGNLIEHIRKDDNYYVIKEAFESLLTPCDSNIQ